jgi:SPP1 gp7 family putative phage head morphogenesis protein
MIDALTRHQIYIQRYLKGVYNDVEPLIKALLKDLNERIAKATTNEIDRIVILRRELEAIVNAHLGKISDATIQQLIDFYDYESAFTVKLLDTETIPSYAVIGAGLSPEAIKATVGNLSVTLNGETMTIKDMIRNFGKAQARQIELAIQTGITQGKTTQQIVTDIKSMMGTRSKAQAEAVILTAGNAIGSKARSDVWSANSEILMGEEYVATLDSRTTIICASLDGKIYSVGTGAQPPLHYRCRSIRVPKLKPEYELKHDKQRSSVDGTVSASTTYEQFLRRQDKAFQDEVLGKQRAQLFRDGKVSLSGFVDKSGKVYTLEQLKQLS